MSAIENGKTGVPAERIARLAEELGVPVQRLLAAPDATPPHPGSVRQALAPPSTRQLISAGPSLLLAGGASLRW